MRIRASVVARGVTTGAVLLGAGIADWRFAGPAVELAIRRAELLAAEPPRALPVPVEGVDPADLADTWGDPRSGGARAHQGIDIFARRRTPVRATTAGIVVRLAEAP